MISFLIWYIAPSIAVQVYFRNPNVHFHDRTHKAERGERTE